MSQDRILFSSTELEKVRANCLNVEADEKHLVDEQMIPFM